MGGAYCSVKHGYEKKNAAYSQFYKSMRLRPQRALILLILYLAYELGMSEIKSLSTQGAKNLSLLKRSKEPLDYDFWLKSCGFEKNTQNDNWLQIEGLVENFYDTLGRKNDRGFTSIMPQKTDGLDALIDAFNNLGIGNGNNTIILCSNSSKEELEKVFNAFKKIHRRDK